jgi:hypothetical protein
MTDHILETPHERWADVYSLRRAAARAKHHEDRDSLRHEASIAERHCRADGVPEPHTFTAAVQWFFNSRKVEEEGHADVDAWHAPSECHIDVANGHDRSRRRYVETTGWTDKHLEMEARRRGLSERWQYWILLCTPGDPDPAPNR